MRYRFEHDAQPHHFEKIVEGEDMGQVIEPPTAQARPFEQVIAEWKTHVILKGGSEGEHYALRALELHEEAMRRMVFAIFGRDLEENEQTEVGLMVEWIEGLRAENTKLLKLLEPVGPAPWKNNEERLAMVFDVLLSQLGEAKPTERSDKQRYYAVTITDLEKVMAYFKTFIVQP